MRYDALLVAPDQWTLESHAGLIFGVTTCTWIFSGLLSMDPWDWHPGTAPRREQRNAVSGGALHLGWLTVERVCAALQAMPPAQEIGVVQFRGDLFFAADRALVPVLAPERGVVSRFADGAIEDAARAAMPGIDIEDAAWLHAYDWYYCDRRGEQPLPVLRVRFADPPRTWLYLDPGRGAIVRKEERLTRINPWLYHSLHSLDFPFLYDRRPLWDIVMIALSIGGLVSPAASDSSRRSASGASMFDIAMFRCLIVAFVAALIATTPLVAQANVTGEWEASFVTPLGPQELKIYLTQEGPRVSGHTTSEFGEFPIKGSINGQEIQLSWSLTDNGKTVEVRVTAKVEGESMKGSARLGDAGNGPFAAERTGS